VTVAALLYAVLGATAGLAVGLAFGISRTARLREQLAAREAELKSSEALEEERERALELATERIGGVFGQLASRQFQSHSETFLKLARESLGVQNERAKGELAAREQAIENLVRPIRDALTRAELQMQELDKSRRETHGSISAQLEALAASQQALSAETRNLVSALRRPEVRGQWGEITLRRLVELAGMIEHCDFVTQSHQPTETGAIRPDMVIRLPEQRDLVVDVKTPLDAYLEATEAPSDTERRAALDRHAAIVAGRVRELASKSYWSQFERSPEFVILFIPGDQFLSAALAQKPELLDEALRQNIILATPTSFVALLKAVAYGWQQVSLAENAAEIRGLAVQLYERLTTFGAHLNDMGKALGDSVKAFNRGVGSLERMVLPSARRFTDLGVQPRQRLATLKDVEEAPRDYAAPDPAREPTTEPAQAVSGASLDPPEGLPSAEPAPGASLGVSAVALADLPAASLERVASASPEDAPSAALEVVAPAALEPHLRPVDRSH
jgi:DNA recombination protein RmuC